MDPVLLPHIDEHATNIAADSDAVWAAVILTLRNAFSGALGLWFAGLVGAESKEAADWSNPVSGSTLPGFKVEAMERPTLITLTGRSPVLRICADLSHGGDGRPSDLGAQNAPRHQAEGRGGDVAPTSDSRRNSSLCPSTLLPVLQICDVVAGIATVVVPAFVHFQPSTVPRATNYFVDAP